MSASPGITVLPPASITRTPAGTATSPERPTARITPPAIRTVVSARTGPPVPSMTVAWVTARSAPDADAVAAGDVPAVAGTGVVDGPHPARARTAATARPRRRRRDRAFPLRGRRATSGWCFALMREGESLAAGDRWVRAGRTA